MDIRVVNKTLDVSRIQRLIRQGENLSDVFTIVMDRHYLGLDRGSLTWRMRGKSEKNTLAENLLLKAVHEKDVILTWKVTDDFTQVEGDLRIELIGSGQDGKIRSVIDAAPLYIPPDVGNGFTYPPGVWDTIIDRVQEAAGESVQSAAEAKRSAEAAAKSAVKAGEEAVKSADSAAKANHFSEAADRARMGAEKAQSNAEKFAQNAKETEKYVDQSKDAAGAYAETAKAAAQGVAASAGAALASENAARSEADRAAREADRSGREADRSEEAAKRAADIANLYFENPHTKQMELLQTILTENFGFLFDLIRKLHSLGLSWKQIREKGLTWRQIQELHLSWREINVLGLTSDNITDLRRMLMGR